MQDSFSTSPPDVHTHRVTPRFLAGPAAGDVTAVLNAVTACGWDVWNDLDYNAHAFSPDHRLAVEFLPEAAAPVVYGQHGVWHIWVRIHDFGQPLWDAWFTNDVPAEVLIPFITALAADPESALRVSAPAMARSARDDERALAPLAAEGWAPDPTGLPRTFHAPGLQGLVTHEPEPGRAGQDRPHWMIGARFHHAEAFQWVAVLADTVPLFLLTALCAALGDPTPAIRYGLADGSVDGLRRDAF